MTNFCAARYATASAEAKLPGSSAGSFAAFTMLASPVSCSQFLHCLLYTSLHQNYLKRKASGAQKRYEGKIKGRKKAEIEAKKAAIRAEDIRCV